MARTASALHILVKDKELAENIITKLKKGQMAGPFDKVCFTAELFTPHLVKTKFGWHVVKILYRT